MADYPLLYVLNSELLKKPCHMVVVDKPDEFYSFDYSGGTAPVDMYLNYDGDSRSIFNDPRNGIHFLPIGMRNQLQVNAEIIEGASLEQIRSLIDEIASLDPRFVSEKLAESEKDSD